MEYDKHIKRLVLGYLKKDCKNSYKVFLKYNFHNQHKHIPTRVAGQTLEDILRIYSRIEEIVQGHLEDTNYYKERSVEFSSPIYLDDQLLYLLQKDRPFTPSSTPCPRSPAESSVVESQHDNEVFTTNDIETTPEHTLPGNISSQDEDYQSKTPFRKGSKSPIFTTPCLEKLPILNKEANSEVMISKHPEKKSANNIDPALNTPDISCFPHRGENEKNKEGVGTELDDMLQHFLATSDVNAVGKAVRAESTTPAKSSNRTHSTTSSTSWQPIDDHNNRAVSSILAAASMPKAKSASFVTTPNDNMGYNDNLNSFQEQPASSALQVGSAATSFTNNQYLLPTSVGMYIVPQPSTSAVQSGNQQQQFYIVNQPVCIPQQTPVMQFLQPLAPANNPVVIHPNQNSPLIKDNVHLSEQDIMTMPTIIINECNEITHADPGSFPTNTPLKGKEAHNLKEYINLYAATDQSPILNLKRQGQKKGSTCRPPLKPTPTIKVEIFQCEGRPTSAIGTSNTDNSESVSNQINIGSVGCKGLPNLNDFTECQFIETTQKDSSKLITKEISDALTSNDKIESHDKSKTIPVGAICTPSPLETNVRKPTPKSNSHVRNLSFPSPNRKTSEKTDSKRSSPRIINKQQAAKDLFRSASEDENKSATKLQKVTNQSSKSAKPPTKVAKRTPKQSKNKSAKSPVKNSEKEKTKPSKETTNTEVVEENATQEVEKNITPKYCWDSNLRKLVPPIIEKNATPRRVSTRKKARPSLELDAADIDGKKLEDALKTPVKKEKPKRKTPNRKKNAKISNTKKVEDNLESHDIETKGETKILSPSKLNANKRNILLNDVDDVTPNINKDSSQYPITSKTRRNISSLLETPIKDDFIPPTPGEVPDKTDTPFTPMLRANLEGFTEGDTFSINTPNFPVTPGFAAMANTSGAYYILNDNESNKVTEATVLLEEKKSSVRKSDDEDIELSPRVYGSKEILDNFNKSCVGKKNLELLDNRGVTWDGSSDKEEKSRDNSENNSDDESNNTVIQTQKVEPANEVKVLSRNSRASGKCMATLQLLKGPKDQPEDFPHAPELGSQKDDGTKTQGDEKDEEHRVEDKLQANTITKSCSSGSESEILSKKSYGIKNSTNKLPVLNTDSDSEKLSKVQENIRKIGETVVEQKIEINQSNKNITQGKYTITTQEVRQTISDVCLETNLGQTTTISLQAQLEEKKKRWIELEKAKQPVGTRKAPTRRAALKPQPKLNPVRSRRKSQSSKTVVKSNEDKDTLQTKDKNKKDIETDRKESEVVESIDDLGIDTEYHSVDSQDEFFKKSGTNLHRKSKGTATNKVPESRTESNDDGKMREDPVGDEINNENIKFSSEVNKNQNDQETLEDQLNKPVVVQNSPQENVPKAGSNISTASNNPDEFEKSWEDCHTSAFEREQLVVYHDESKAPDKKLEDYNVGILQKKIVLGVPCSDGSIVNITLTASAFDTLLEVKPSDECEMTDGNRDEVDSSFETLDLKPEAVSDSENPGSKPDNTDFKCAKKRKHRSDSCNSNSSAKRIMTKEMFNAMNIQKLLATLYPEKTKGSLD